MDVIGPSSDLAIRPATRDDARELARLRWDFSPAEVAAGAEPFDTFAREFEGFVRDALDGGDWLILVAERDGRLVANLYAYLVRKVPRPGAFGRRLGYVTNVYAEPDVRNRGVGSRLLAEAVARARGQGSELLVVWPSAESVRFYERAGFARSREIMELCLDG